MSIYWRDAVVALMALMGIVSDLNFMDIPFWTFIVLVFTYAMLRLYSNGIKIKK
jgi:hypothetical protein